MDYKGSPHETNEPNRPQHRQDRILQDFKISTTSNIISVRNTVKCLELHLPNTMTIYMELQQKQDLVALAVR